MFVARRGAATSPSCMSFASTARAISMLDSGPSASAHIQHHPRQLAAPELVAALAAALPGPDRHRVCLRAHDAASGVGMHKVGPELPERGVRRFDLVGQLGTLTDQGGGHDVGYAAMIEGWRLGPT